MGWNRNLDKEPSRSDSVWVVWVRQSRSHDVEGFFHDIHGIQLFEWKHQIIMGI